jgi:phosphoribosyl-AMP cyclohydrolase
MISLNFSPHLHITPISTQHMTYLSHLFPTAVSFSASQKHLWSATEEAGQAAKHKAISGDAPDVQTHCVVIHETIKVMPDNLNLSNPLTFTTLPCPLLSLMPSQCFEMKAINGINHFKYMGRSYFHELQWLIESEDFLHASKSLFALVYYLIHNGKCVIYIPDYSILRLGLAEQMWKALMFAFYNSAALRSTGDSHVNTFICFISQCQDLYIIVDQVNALDISEDDGCRAPTLQAIHWLDVWRLNHLTCYIFSASVNETSNQEVDRKQSRILVFQMFGGMSKV